MVRSLGGRGVRICSRILPVGAVALALWLPAGALATTSEKLTTVSVAKNDGFKLSLLVQSGSLAVFLDRHMGKGVGSTAEHDFYDFTQGVTFVGSADLAKARAKGTLPDSRGSIDMKFHATRPEAKLPVPKGCMGTPGKQRKGMLTGSFKLKADKLGTERLRSIGATLEQPPSLTCKIGGGGHATELIGGSLSGDIQATKPRRTGPVQEHVSIGVGGTGFSFSYDLFVLAPRSHYTFSSDLSSATLKGYGPINGSATFSGPPETGGNSNGSLSGNLSGHTAAIGTIKPFAGGPFQADQAQF